MRTVKFALLIAVLAGSALLSACAATAPTRAALAQGETPQAEPVAQPDINRTIAVSGMGKVTLTPDIAYISIGVHTENKDARQAVSNNNAQSTDLMTALQKAGVDSKDIRTTNFSIYPRQERDSKGEVIGITYVVDNTVYVTVRDLDNIGTLLNAAVDAGANNIGGIQFDIADRTAAYQQALEAAMNDARAQAEVLAGAAGVEVGEVQQINASVGYAPPPIVRKAAGMEMAMADSVPISAGQMEVSVTVSVVFGIK